MKVNSFILQPADGKGHPGPGGGHQFLIGNWPQALHTRWLINTRSPLSRDQKEAVDTAIWRYPSIPSRNTAPESDHSAGSLPPPPASCLAETRTALESSKPSRIAARPVA